MRLHALITVLASFDWGWALAPFLVTLGRKTTIAQATANASITVALETDGSVRLGFALINWDVSDSSAPDSDSVSGNLAVGSVFECSFSRAGGSVVGNGPCNPSILPITGSRLVPVSLGTDILFSDTLHAEGDTYQIEYGEASAS